MYSEYLGPIASQSTMPALLLAYNRCAPESVKHNFSIIRIIGDPFV